MAAGIAVLGVSALAVPARADTYTSYLVARLRADPVYISSYSEMSTQADALAIKRLIGRIPLQTFVVADIAAGPDGELDDSDLAAVLHDQLGGGLFILARESDGTATATGFGTSLPVSDAMTAADDELGFQGGPGSLAGLMQRFVTILLSGKTEQRLAADERAQEQQVNPGQVPTSDVLSAIASGAAVGCAITSFLLISGRRRRRRRPIPVGPGGSGTHT